MHSMNDKHITRLESQIEKLVESAFTTLFRRQVSAHDMAIQLARSMEDNLRPSPPETDQRPIAPNEYILHLHPNLQSKVMQTRPPLGTLLTEQLIELATHAGYRLHGQPSIKIVANPKLKPTQVIVRARHRDDQENSTEGMQPVRLPTKHIPPLNAHFIIEGKRNIPLTEPLINIGRSDDNHIILDDAYASRHHAQLRLRFGTYVLFDVDSRAGLFVNKVRTREHHLQAGDVIQIGATRLVYVDDADDPITPSPTQSLDPIDT
jgi:hypothetical protein